ncbi:MAG: hypothetical protein NWQ46_08235 [Spirosomaceae bacterium]|nr:hypothetical protein [Spirosomataceae bacterium]MDP5140392.1 hypothetical protein [Spirosomataceae bacterium]
MSKNNFKDIEEDGRKAPEILKTMVVSEVDFIRNTMQIVSMFLGESFVAAGKFIQGTSSEEK